jgi:hypothetical protein
LFQLPNAWRLMERFTPFTVSIRSTVIAVFCRLALRLCPPTNNRTATLDTLPTEILILISDFLPAESQLSLSLACKRILSALPIQRTRDNCDIETIRRFLYMLMRDPGLSTMYLCSSCPKFYRQRWKRGFWEINCPHHTFQGFLVIESPSPAVVALGRFRWVEVKKT